MNYRIFVSQYPKPASNKRDIVTLHEFKVSDFDSFSEMIRHAKRVARLETENNPDFVTYTSQKSVHSQKRNFEDYKRMTAYLNRRTGDEVVTLKQFHLKDYGTVKEMTKEIQRQADELNKTNVGKFYPSQRPAANWKQGDFVQIKGNKKREYVDNINLKLVKENYEGRTLKELSEVTKLSKHLVKKYLREINEDWMSLIETKGIRTRRKILKWFEENETEGETKLEVYERCAKHFGISYKTVYYYTKDIKGLFFKEGERNDWQKKNNLLFTRMQTIKKVKQWFVGKQLKHGEKINLYKQCGKFLNLSSATVRQYLHSKYDLIDEEKFSRTNLSIREKEIEKVKKWFVGKELKRGQKTKLYEECGKELGLSPETIYKYLFKE